MRKKRNPEPFGIAFLDCICCGFGAVILLFVLTSGKKSEDRLDQLSDINIGLGELRKNIQAEEEALLQFSHSIEAIKEDISRLTSRGKEVSDELEEKKADLILLLTELADLEKLRESLLEQTESLPIVTEEVPIPMPNPIRRQYLTDFKLDGNRVMFLLEASGGMLGEIPETAIERLKHSDEEKHRAPKWQRSSRAVEWLLTTLKPPTRYQIYFFNQEAYSIFPTRATEWLDLRDRQTTADALAKIKEITPQSGANLEQAFFYIGVMNPPPDNIILITDGLPTQSNREPAGPIVDEATRLRMFKYAKQLAPKGVPINVILMPMSGDPAAASLYWLLASESRGSFICPAKTWPEI